MKCPFCSHTQTGVVDSRLGKDGAAIRRRRECEACKERFTTYERIEELLPMVVKKDGRREAFDRMKVLAGLKKAFEKRPVGAAAIEGVLSEIEREIQTLGEQEIPSSTVGEVIMRRLRELDQVAYVRFASVYRSFKDIGEFMTELEDLGAKRQASDNDT